MITVWEIDGPTFASLCSDIDRRRASAQREES